MVNKKKYGKKHFLKKIQQQRMVNKKKYGKKKKSKELHLAEYAEK